MGKQGEIIGFLLKGKVRLTLEFGIPFLWSVCLFVYSSAITDQILQTISHIIKKMIHV